MSQSQSQALTIHKTNLEKFKPEFAKVLPPHMTPDRIIRSVVNALSANKYLCENADQTSVLQAAMTAAVLGLDVDNVTGQGYIVPFKGKAQFIPGYKGYITLAANSGFLVSGDVVREKDFFSYRRGLNPDLQHTPAPGSATERGPIVYAYAVARSNTLPADFRVLHLEQVHALRNRSEGYKSFLSGKMKDTPWETDFEAMAIKSAIRALAPELPLNVQRAAALEGCYERGRPAYLNDIGNVVEVVDTSSNQNPGTSASQLQPDLVADLNLEEKPQSTGTNCSECDGSRFIDGMNCLKCNP